MNHLDKFEYLFQNISILNGVGNKTEINKNVFFFSVSWGTPKILGGGGVFGLFPKG